MVRCSAVRWGFQCERTEQDHLADYPYHTARFPSGNHVAVRHWKDDNLAPENLFVPLIQYSDSESEVWRFWIQLADNLDELIKLETLVDEERYYGKSTFEFNLGKPVAESEVDILVKHTVLGYIDAENKLVGRFTCPADISGIYRSRVLECAK